MTPSETGTKPGQTEAENVPGIRLRTEERYHLAPWQLRLYHSGKESYTFHASFGDALKAKAKADRLKKKEGARALGYDRAAQLEYEEAKRILGPGANLVEVARQMAARIARGHMGKKVPEAVDEYLAIKLALRRSRKHVQDIRQRLVRFADTYCDRDIETITRADVLGFVLGLKRDDESRKVGLAPRTLWNFYGLIASLFHHAHRAGWVENNPCAKIDPDTDLPEKPKGMVEILTPQQGKAIMRQIEQHEPIYIGWACLQYFLGIRDAEAERFRGEWLQRKARRVIIPGWSLEGEIAEPVTKTRDDWVIDKVPTALWDWMERYPEAFSSGPIPYPSAPAWTRTRDAVIAAGHLTRWPRNGFRHSFATYHLSWLRDAQATSFILRHRAPQKLWDSYFARFVSKAEGKRYLSLQPLP